MNRHDASPDTPTYPIASVIIPAFNEESVIGRTLEWILAEAAPGEFDILVVCNGCHDRTAEVARGFGDLVRVAEIARPSKTDALNLGGELAHTAPRVFVDADVRLSTGSLRRLVHELIRSGKCLAAGRMNIDQTNCDTWVRAFHRVWQLQPYFDRGKVGGVFALSREGCLRIGGFPSITADDEFVRRSFSSTDCVFVEGCSFSVDAPRTLRSLVRVKGRVRRGNIELNSKNKNRGRSRGRSRALFFQRILRRPTLWPSVPTYLGIVIAAEIRARRAIARKEHDWSQDTTTRRAVRAKPGIGA